MVKASAEVQPFGIETAKEGAVRSKLTYEDIREVVAITESATMPDLRFFALRASLRRAALLTSVDIFGSLYVLAILFSLAKS
jgi:hypothetical protein